MFQLTLAEYANLRSQIATSSSQYGGRRYLPYAFTEHGALMLANVLNSERAAQTSVMVVRAFVKLRQMLATNAELSRKLEALEKKYDVQFKVIFDAIRQLMSPSAKSKREIGFHVKYDDDKPRQKSVDRHALRAGFTIEEIFNLTKIDRWFLVQIKEIVNFQEELGTGCEKSGIG
jgi:phage regulator Rha-like protein